MKLKVGNKVYLQKYEVAHILNGARCWIPSSVIQELLDKNEEFFFMQNLEVDGFRFECVYEEPKNVAWLMKQDWIVDFHRYSKMSLTELENINMRLKTKLSNAVDEFYGKNKAYAGTNFAEEHERLNAYISADFAKEHDRLDKLGFKIASLSALIGFRRGEIKFVFPDYKL